MTKDKPTPKRPKAKARSRDKRPGGMWERYDTSDLGVRAKLPKKLKELHRRRAKNKVARQSRKDNR